MARKVWRTLPPPPPGFAESLSLPPLHAGLLYNRGLTHSDDVEAFLSADSRLATDPLALPDMDKAVARLERALERGETVAVFGDFDVDGVSATAILVLALEDLGLTVAPYLPDRTDEGHGLNSEAVGVLRAQGSTLMITADCGSNSAMEIELGSSLGMDTVVTDHHTIQESVADAVAVINPRRWGSDVPESGLTGAGLAYKLAEALYSSLGRDLPEDLIGLAALGTVADVGPLQQENRYIVTKGLDVLSRTRRPGIQALISRSRQARGPLSAETLSFWLIPRLNAAGRLGDPKLSLDLLTTDSPSTAERIADELNELNAKRRVLSDEALAQADEQVRRLGDEMPPVLLVEHTDWIPGILGLIAGRLSEEYYRPAVAVARNGDVCRASARSIPEFDIVAALEANEDMLLRFGGHPMAAGFSASRENLPKLGRKLLGLAAEQLSLTELSPSIDIDAEVGPAGVVGSNFRFIQSLAPFGAANPEPTFLGRGVRVTSARTVGSDNAHLKMRLSSAGAEWDAIAFRQSHDLAPGDTVDIVYNVGVDDWGGTAKVQLNIVDLQVAERTGDVNTP